MTIENFTNEYQDFVNSIDDPIIRNLVAISYTEVLADMENNNGNSSNL